MYASQRRIVIPPISVDERGGLRSIGELVFMVMILSSGGLTIVIGWVIIFKEIDESVRFVIILYGVVLTFLYVLPMFYLSVALKHSRERHLSVLTAIFTVAYSTAVGVVGVRDSDRISKARSSVDELASLDAVYGRVERMPRSPVSMFMNIAATIYLSGPLAFAPTVFRHPGTFKYLFEHVQSWFR